MGGVSYMGVMGIMGIMGVMGIMGCELHGRLWEV